MTRSRRLPLLLALAVLLVAAACSSDKSSTTTASSGGGGTIRLGFSAWPGWFPWQVAKEKGIFDAAGIKVEPTYFESYTDSLNALSAGKLDANSQTLNDTISSVAAGAKEKVVLVNDNSTGNDQIIAKPGINSVADLKGKKIGIEEGTVDHFLLLLGLDKAGLSAKDVEIQPLATDAAAAAFAAGQLDAVGVFAPFTTKALELPGSKAIFTSADFPGAIPDHLVVSQDLVEKRPGDVQKLVNAWYKTLAWIQANPAEANAIMAKRAGVSVADYEAYGKGTRIFSVADNVSAFSPGNDMSRLNFAANSMAKFLLDNKLITAAPDLKGLLQPQFVQEAAKTP
ncbi:MAG: ABC transporter substrate-binding protein [Actinomycetota bacterium]|nr:ABC transporter substrate-binding protein [Actinomycetota bacterium]